MFLAVNRGMGAAQARRPVRVIIMPRRRGVGAVAPPAGFYTGLATGICEGGFDTGDGSPCTPAVPGAQGGISTQELAAMNASLNPGVAPITVADIIANGALSQQAAAALSTGSGGQLPAPVVYTPPAVPPASAAYAPPPVPPAPAAAGSGVDPMEYFFTGKSFGIPAWWWTVGVAVGGYVLFSAFVGGQK
jgi:hypothetical protein